MVFRVRQLSNNVEDELSVGGDMTFGRSGTNFLVDSPTAVAQCVYTRLRLWMGEWFLNLGEGTPWLQQILQHPPGGGVPDSAIRNRILSTPYVTGMTDYSSTYSSTNRTFSVSCQLFTSFGKVTTAPIGSVISPTGAVVFILPTRPSLRTQALLSQPPRRLPPPRSR